MEKIRKTLKGRKGTWLLAALAVICLLGSGLGSAWAALQIYSDYYEARVGMYDIGITLTENGESIASRDYSNQMAQGEESDGWTKTEGALLEDMLKESDGRLVLNRKYKEELAVVNSGSIPEYVRVRIYRYWVDPKKTDDEGNEQKVTTMDPKWIKLELNEEGWWKNEAECTDECIVLYYRSELPTGGAASFCKSITIDGAVANKVTKTQVSDGVVKTTYDYEGKKFVLEVDADAVQNHNAEDAIRSAWGVDPSYIN